LETSEGEFRRGWPIVLGAFLGYFGSFGSLYIYSVGLFMKPLVAEFGWSRSEASLGALAMTVGSFLAYPIAGRLLDRFGERRVAMVAVLGVVLGFIMLGLGTHGLMFWLLTIVLMVVLSAGVLAYSRTIVGHFRRRRGVALGLALMGIGLGAIVVPFAMTQIVSAQGWRTGYLVLAAVALPLGIAAVLLIRNTPRSENVQDAGAVRVFRHPAFFTIGGIILLASVAVFGSTMHLMPMLTDSGLTPVEAGGIASLLGFAVLISRVFTGVLLDRWDAGWVTAILLGLAALGAVLLWTAVPVLVIPGAMLLGLGVGTEADLVAYLLGRRFPVRVFGQAYGAIFSVHVLGVGFGGFLAGVVFDSTGGYGIWLLCAAGALIGAALIAFTTERNVAAPGS
jgi:MFS family permease